MRIHCRVRVQVHQAAGWDAGLERIEVVLGMHPQQLLAGGGRRLALHQVADQAGSDQLVFDGMQPVRALGMMLPHVVQQAVAMAYQGSVHGQDRQAPMVRGCRPAVNGSARRHGIQSLAMAWFLHFRPGIRCGRGCGSQAPVSGCSLNSRPIRTC